METTDTWPANAYLDSLNPREAMPESGQSCRRGADVGTAEVAKLFMNWIYMLEGQGSYLILYLHSCIYNVKAFDKYLLLWFRKLS